MSAITHRTMGAAEAQEAIGELADAIACGDAPDRHWAAAELRRVTGACAPAPGIAETVRRLLDLADLVPSRWEPALLSAAEMLHEHYAGVLN